MADVIALPIPTAAADTADGTGGGGTGRVSTMSPVKIGGRDLNGGTRWGIAPGWWYDAIIC